MSFGVMRKMEEIGEVEEEEEEEENNKNKKQVVDRMGMSSSSSNEGEEFVGTMDVFRRENRATLQFKLPLYTQWGQNLLLVGSDPLLGSWDLARAKHMLPRHEGDAQLIWEVGVSVPANFHSQYSYCMVDEHMNVLKWEAGARRSLELPEGLENGAVVEVHDQWQDGSSPDALLQTSAFKNVIFRKDHHGSESVVKKRDIITSESAPERLFFADPIGLGDRKNLQEINSLKVHCKWRRIL
jgi:hypothetical protein